MPARLATFPFQLMLAILVVSIAISGCRLGRFQIVDLGAPEPTGYSEYLEVMQDPQIDQASFVTDESELSQRPFKVSDFEKAEFRELSLEEAIQLVLNNSQVLSKIGGQVISAPAAASTIFDPGLQSSSPLNSEEAALSSFDARWDTTFNFNRSERKFNNAFIGGGASQLISNASNFNSAITKQTPFGSTFGVRRLIDYSRNNSPVNRFASFYDMVLQAEFRQSLLRGGGSMVNQVAGPNSAPGVYNGVLIARINQNISQSDFEIAVRDLIREVERNYWELYFAYRNLDNLIESRDKAFKVMNVSRRRKAIDKQSPLSIPRNDFSYFSFQAQVENALVGANGSVGVLNAERELRRLCGLTAVDGQLLRPSSEPTVAEIDFDWDSLQVTALERRAELRRQQWTVQQRELEYRAARNLNRWQLDFVANYGWRGFGDNLAGSRSFAEGSALEDLWSGDLDDWNMGFEFGGPLGKRQTQLAVRNAEMALAKARAVFREQHRQVVIDLSSAYSEADRAFTLINSRHKALWAAEKEANTANRRFNVEVNVLLEPEAQQREADARTAFIRAIVDYNIAIMNVAYQSGRLLERYNVHLSEGAIGNQP